MGIQYLNRVYGKRRLLLEALLLLVDLLDTSPSLTRAERARRGVVPVPIPGDLPKA